MMNSLVKKSWMEKIPECSYLIVTSSILVLIALTLEFVYYLVQFLLYVEHHLMKTVKCYPARVTTTAVPQHPTPLAADCNLTNGRAADTFKGNHNNSEETKK